MPSKYEKANLPRIVALRERIKNTSEEALDLDKYVGLGWEDDPDYVYHNTQQGFINLKEGVCGSVGCIAGHCCVMMPAEELIYSDIFDTGSKCDLEFSKSAQKWLGLTTTTVSWLFNFSVKPGISDKEEALQRLDKLIAKVRKVQCVTL